MIGPLDAVAIRRSLTPRWVGRTIVYLADCDSTNSEVLRRVSAEAGGTEGLVVIAEHQTAGRGRLGRSWHAPRGASLLMTAVVAGGAPAASRVVLATGIAIREAVHATCGVDAELAWPNDVSVHLGGHHRVGGKSHLFDGFQQHLPHPGQGTHRQAGGHVLTPALLVGGRGRIFGRRRIDLDDGNPVGDFRKVAEDGHRIGAIGILGAEFGQGGRGIALHDQVKEVECAASVGKAQHGADLIARSFSRAMGDGLVHQAHRVADRAFGGAGDQGEGVLRQFRAF